MYIIVIVLICFVAFILYGKIFGNNIPINENIDELKDLYSYDAETQTFTVKRRSPHLSKVLKIKDKHDIVVKYVPEKVHVGAVSVGGVTSGGTFTTGGYNNIVAQNKNGLCALEYNGQEIRKIKLYYQIYKEACKDVRVHYAVNEACEIQVIDDVERSEFDRLLALSNYSRTGYVGNKAANAGYPTKEWLKGILEFLTDDKVLDINERILKDKLDSASNCVNKCPTIIGRWDAISLNIDFFTVDPEDSYIDIKSDGTICFRIEKDSVTYNGLLFGYKNLNNNEEYNKFGIRWNDNKGIYDDGHLLLYHKPIIENGAEIYMSLILNNNINAKFGK